MSNPLNRLKRLPWRSLIQTAILTLLTVVLLNGLLLVALVIPGTASVLLLLFQGGLGLLISVAAAVGIGALAVVILERLNRPAINTASLWGLVLCLIVAFLVVQLFSLPDLLMPQSQMQFVCVMLGVFWRGASYWRGYRRW